MLSSKETCVTIFWKWIIDLGARPTQGHDLIIPIAIEITGRHKRPAGLR